jgi:DNA-binding transcriptional LysR family regulator
LERGLGGRLFERSSRRVELTAYGRRVRDAIAPCHKQLLAAIDEVTLSAPAVAGTLRVGMFGLSSGPDWDGVLRRFQAANPRCEVQSVDVHLGDPSALLRAGEIDVTTMWLPAPDLPGIAAGPTIFQDNRAVLVAADHPLAERAELHWDDLADYAVSYAPGIPAQQRELIVPRMTPNGRALRHLVTVHNFTEVVAAVARGQIVHPTIASVGDYFRRPGVVTRPLVDAEPLRSAIFYRAGPQPPAVRAFLEIVEASGCAPRTRGWSDQSERG